MTSPTSLRRTSFWADYGPMAFLLGFTLVAISGFYLFTLPPHGPQNLQFLAQDYPFLLSFYTVSFSFFAQVHVWLTAGVLFLYLKRKVGWVWLGTFGAIYLASFVSEFVGTEWGIPFGPYSYTELLGPKLFDHVPWVIPLSWYTMALPAYLLARRAFPDDRRPWARILFASYLLTCWDLALDPAMSYLVTYWVWDIGGPYYGMPWINLFGWYVTGVVLMALFWKMKADRWAARLPVRWMQHYYLATLSLPVLMTLAAGLWWAVAATILAVAAGFGLIYLRRSSDNDAGANETGVPQTPAHHHASASASADVTDLAPTLAVSTHETESIEAAVNTQAVRDDVVRDDVATLADCLPTDLNAFFASNSLTFSFAASWFRTEQKRLICLVYAYCRVTDDLVDQAEHLNNQQLLERLATWERLTEQAFRGQPSGIDWLDELMTASAKAEVPYEHICDLIEGVRMDIGHVRLQNVLELRLYSYRVASVVGLWICHLLGVKDPVLLQRASALGQALQLTNILRDVGEDLARDRIYVPADRMAAHGIDEAALRAMWRGAEISPAYHALMNELLATADADYAAAWEGIARLPENFGKAVAIAAAVYRGIQHRIRYNGYNNFTLRARTSLLEKTALGTSARFRLLWHRRHADTPLDARPVYFTSLKLG